MLGFVCLVFVWLLMSILKLVISAAVIFIFSGAAIAQPKIRPTVALEKQVTSLATLLSDGYAEEFTKARTYHVFDIFEHGLKDTVVFFTLEGESQSTYYGFYMAVFENVELIDPAPNDSIRYRLIAYAHVGGKGWRNIDFGRLSYSKGQFRLITQEYSDQDPMCCPSKKGTALYKLQKDGLHEVQSKSSQNGLRKMR